MYHQKILLTFLLCTGAGCKMVDAQANGTGPTTSIQRQADVAVTVMTPAKIPTALSSGQPSFGSMTPEDSVKAAVNELFLAMKTSDVARLRASFADSAILQTIVTNKEGKTYARNESIADFAESIGKLPKGAADERIRFDLIKIDGPLAMVWAPYNFYFKEKFSHCGIDSFQLLLSGGVWKILYIVDTRRKEGCE